MGLTQVVPPDDSGSRTYRRYRYQAEVAFPYVFACALGEGEVTAVLLEHVEDIAVTHHGIWYLMQVKTRDAGLGPWKLSDICATGGGLDSLYRAYRAVAPVDDECLFQLVLEGAVKNGDDIVLLVNGEAGEKDGLKERIRGFLDERSPAGCSEAEAADFLQRLRVTPLADSRSTIEARNLRLIAARARHLDGTQQEAIYAAFMTLIDRAMIGAGEDLLTRALLDEIGGAESKAIRQGDLSRLSVRLQSGPSVLLGRILDAEAGLTQLAQKLEMGNAAPNVVEDAKSLRAQASYWEMQQMSAGILDDETLEDVRFRLQVLSNSVIACTAPGPAPANAVWSTLLDSLTRAPSEYDRRRAFNADPMLLLGEVCEISDHCRVGWGVASA